MAGSGRTTSPAPASGSGTICRRWRSALGLELLPVVIEADASASPGELPIGGQTQIELPNNHLQYAITWYGLAAALVAVYVAFGVQRQEERG